MLQDPQAQPSISCRPEWLLVAIATGMSPIRAARQKIKLTQKQIAMEIGISQHYFADIENGRKSGGKVLNQIAAVLGVEPHWLFIPLVRNSAAPQTRVSGSTKPETADDCRSNPALSPQSVSGRECNQLDLSQLVLRAETPLSALPISRRTQKTLYQQGIATVADLKNMSGVSKRDLMRWPKVGTNVATEIMSIVNSLLANEGSATKSGCEVTSCGRKLDPAS